MDASAIEMQTLAPLVIALRGEQFVDQHLMKFIKNAPQSLKRIQIIESDRGRTSVSQYDTKKNHLCNMIHKFESFFFFFLKSFFVISY